MAYEKRLKAVPPQLFTADGTNLGKVTIPDACAFKVKTQVILNSSTQGTLRLEVKRVESDTVLFVGPIKDHQHNASILDRTDILAFLVADGAFIFAEEQKRPNIPEQEIERLTYEEEPTIARRTILVDSCGDKISTINPLPVSATVTPTIVGTPSLFNVTCPTAGVEYSQLMPNGTTQLQLRARNSTAKLQLAWVPGTTGTNYLTLTPGNIYILENVKLTTKTVYFRSTKDDTIVEILSWA